ncbi:hypothetical protein [Paraburkholderia tropica]|uniref:hypothetical protein n=1 Tax=Paraburkholderia tropica TaxID=92647 RepID=UPI003D2A20B8
MTIPLNFKKPAQPTASAPVAEPPATQDRIASAVALNAAMQAFNAETIPVLDRMAASINRMNASSRALDEECASIVAGTVEAAPSDDGLVQDMLRAGRAAGTRSIVETAARLHRDLAANKHVRLDADGLRTLADLAVTLNQALARMGASGSAGA